MEMRRATDKGMWGMRATTRGANITLDSQGEGALVGVKVGGGRE
jgi:hypothetical protein